MIDANDFIDYIIPIMFWFGFLAGAGVGFLVSAIVAVKFLLRGE